MFRIVLAAMILSPALALSGERVAAPAPAVARVPSQGMTPDLAAKYSDTKKLEIADQDLKTIRKAVDRVAGRAEEARAEKDVGKLNCINAQLTQMKGLGKVATQANEAMVDALSRKDGATANTQFARIVIATDKVSRSAGEADVCLGQLAFLVDGQTQVQVDQPAGLPGQDVTQRAPPPPAVATPPVARPPPASKYY